MQMDKSTSKRIARDALLSVFIYILPIALMGLSFYITGQRPWKKPVKVASQTKLTGRRAGDFK